MGEITDGFLEAITLIVTMNPELMEIAGRSLYVSSIATLVAALIAIPIGAIIYYYDFRGKRTIINLIQTLYALPTVIVGLLVYLLVSNSGPLGPLKLLYTTNAMIIAQVILVSPLIVGLAIAALSGLDKEMKYTTMSLNARAYRAMVGAVMMVGGNIRHFTRTLTTAITLNTSMGEFSTSIALGIILLTIALIVNFGVNFFQHYNGRMKDD